MVINCTSKVVYENNRILLYDCDIKNLKNAHILMKINKLSH